MTVPVISKHAREIGASPTVAGLIGSVYGFLQLFSCPSVGRWSDVVGRRPVLAWCLLLSAVGYASLGFASSIIVLLLARIPAGVFKHSQELSKAYLADIVPRSQHSHIFGQFNSISNIGFIIGPVIGGYIVDYLGGFHVVSVLTAGVFLLNFVLVQVILRSAVIWVPAKQSTEVDDRDLSRSSDGQHARSRNGHAKRATASPGCVNWCQIWEIMLARFLLGAAVLVYRSDFAVIMSQRYATSNTMNGYISALSSIVGTLTGFAVGYIASLYADNAHRLFSHAAIAQSLSLLVIALAPTMTLLAIGHAALAFACAIGRVAGVEVTLVSASRQHTGALIGAGATVLSVARMLAPATSGISQEIFSHDGPIVLSTVLSLLGSIVLLVMPRKTEAKMHRD